MSNFSTQGSFQIEESLPAGFHAKTSRLLESVPDWVVRVLACSGRSFALHASYSPDISSLKTSLVYCPLFVDARVAESASPTDAPKGAMAYHTRSGGGACPSGCFNVHGGALGVVLGALVQLGYGVSFRVLDAQYFGVPQRRRRVFIVGCLGDNGSTPAEVLALAEGVSGDFETSDEEGEDVALDAAESVGSGGVSQPLMAHHGRNNADDNYIVFDQAHRGDGVRLLGDTMKTLDARMGTGRNNVPVVTHALTSRHDSSEDGTGRGVPIVPFVKIVRSGARDDDGSLPAEQWAERDLAPTLNIIDNMGDSRATVLMAFNPSSRDVQASEDVSPVLRSSVGGRPAVMETLRSHPRPGSNSVGAVVVEDYAVRRLTPMECERLQGFPDTWTEGQSDSARYKQMGNAVAVPVVEWLFKRLVIVDQDLNE